MMSLVANIVPMIDLNPLHWLGNKAKETLADGFTSMMMAIWSGAMWLLKTAFSLIDSFTPNVADPGLSKLYSVTLWLALAIALIVAFGQIGLAVIRQDGRGFGTLAAGVIQYGVVLCCWIGVCAGLIAAASGLTKGLLNSLLGVDSFSGYAAGDGFVDTVSGTTQAATLGICALFILIPAAFGHMVIMMVRSAALLILTATMPLTAAGALSEGTKSWMWKSIRWFLACVLMEPLLALVVGMGTQFAWAGMPDGQAQDSQNAAEQLLHVSDTSSNIGMSVVGSIIMLVACFMPMVLFRLLAFVDPGTASGASFRSTMNANGGVSGLLRGKGATSGSSGSEAATETGSDGRTTSENGAEAETAGRFQSSAFKKYGGKVGAVVGGAMDKTGKVAQAGASMGIDILGQGGIGNQGYYDTSHSPRQAKDKHGKAQRMQPLNDTNHDGVANDNPPPKVSSAESAGAEDAVFLA